MNEENKPASVSLPVIQFVDREIEKERLLSDEKLERLRELMTEKFASEAKAQHLAYEELQRRLDTLNHAHEEMVKDKAHFQSKELSEAQQVDYMRWRDSINSTLSNYAGRTIVVIGVIGIVVTLIFKFWK